MSSEAASCEERGCQAERKNEMPFFYIAMISLHEETKSMEIRRVNVEKLILFSNSFTARLILALKVLHVVLFMFQAYS